MLPSLHGDLAAGHRRRQVPLGAEVAGDRVQTLGPVVAPLGEVVPPARCRRQAGLWTDPNADSRPLRQGQQERSRRVAKRNKTMVQIEALRLIVLGIDDKRVNGNLGSARALYRIPQQGAAEFTAVIGESCFSQDGCATQK